MKTKALSTIEKYNMLDNGDTVIVGLSGGADSMSLLHFLNSVREKYNLKLIATHVNHGIRGEEADRDEQFVINYCKANDIDIKVLHADIPAISKECGESEEECGRRIRYEFFNNISDNAKIATAHTLSDNIETLFLNMIRGTTLNGLCGIPPVRGNIIRPLIECTRDEIEKYCFENDIAFVTDSTNLKRDYSRNKVRLDIIPVIREINPSFEANIGKCIASNIEDEKTLDRLSSDLLKKIKLISGYKVDDLIAADVSVRRRTIIKIIQTVTEKMPEFRHVIMVEDILETGGKVQIIDGVYAEVRNSILNVKRAVNITKQWNIKVEDEYIKLPFAKIRFSKTKFDRTQKINKKLFFNSIDSDKIIGDLIIRSRKDADVYRPYGRKCSKTLKKLFNEAKIPSDSRNEVIVLCDDAGIIWIEGFGPDERAFVSESTENILNISVERGM